MAKRPIDWGDRFPSDKGDVVPDKPTLGFSKSNRRVKSIDPRAPINFSDTFEPDLGEETKLPDFRHATPGIIVSYDGEQNNVRYYTVLLQTGKQVQARCYYKRAWEFYQPADPVGLIRGHSDQNELVIVGTPAVFNRARVLYTVDQNILILEPAATLYGVCNTVSYKNDDLVTYNGQTLEYTIKKSGLYTVTYNINFISSNSYWGTLKETLNAYPATANVEVEAFGNKYTFKCKAPKFHTSGTIATNTVVRVEVVDDVWHIVGKTC